MINAANLDYFTYGALFELWPDESRERELVLPKGEYAITVYLTDATSYAANIKVNGNMETTIIEPRSDRRSFEKIVDDMGKRDYILPLGNGRYLIYDSLHEPRIFIPEGVEPLDAVPLDRVDLACYLDDDKVVMLGDEAKAFLFDVSTGDFDPFEPDGLDWGKLPSESGRCADGVVRFASDSQITRVGLAFVEAVDIPTVREIAVGGLGTLAVDTASRIVAVITVARPAGDPTIPEIQDVVIATLVLVDSATGVQRKIELGERVNDFGVSLSPDGGKVAVLDENLVSVYDTATADLLYVVPCNSDAIHWQGNDSFVYVGPVLSDVYLANIPSRESRGLTDESAGIGVSLTTSVVGGFLYFMGFTNDPDEPAHGYRVDVA